MAAALLACVGAACVAGPQGNGPSNDLERIRQRLPGDALAYALVRPEELREALDEIGRRLDPLEPRWGEPGVLWRESLEALGVSEVEALVARQADSLVGLALIRTSEHTVKARRAALRSAVSRKIAPECPAAPAIHLARLGDPEQASPPAAWRLPPPPSRTQPLTFRASVDRVALADTQRALGRLCERTGWEEETPEAAAEAMDQAEACGAAWTSSALAAHRLDLRLGSTDQGAEIRGSLELSMRGARALAAALEAPRPAPISDTSFLSLRVRYDHARARASVRDRITVGPVPGCELHAALAPAFRWPSAAVPGLPGGFADDVGAGLTTLAIDVGPAPQAFFGAQIVADYSRTAATVARSLRRVGLGVTPGEPSVIEVPVIGSALTVRLTDRGPRASQVRIGLGVPPPPAAAAGPDRRALGTLVVRPPRWGELAALLSVFGWEAKPAVEFGTRVEEVALEVLMVPPRLEAVAVLRWKLEGASK